MPLSCLRSDWTQLHLLAGIIQEGIRSGELRQVPAQEAAFAIYDMTRAVITRRILGLEEHEGNTGADGILDLIWRGIGPNVPS